ncbi:AbiJ-NTD4 domain-containing protein [Olivibacter jilunii]|uniref:AbiJ-NTD4 domain-containing protein n=1 Tax=Olivibacter jilunii TaxID=985016 RepID=UPI003F1463A4
MRFSQRIGKKPIKAIFQSDNIDADLKNRLWNVVDSVLERLSSSSNVYFFYEGVWKDFFVIPSKVMPRYTDGTIYGNGCREYLYEWFYDCQWYEIYDFLEYLVNSKEYKFKEAFIDECNEALRLELSSYRIVGSTVVKITSSEEIESIEDAINSTDKQKSVNPHLQAALEFLSDRKKPDYRNSIKESISAVEALCKLLANDDKATLGKALAKIEKNYNLHSSLKSALSALYGYTSDAGGIRHALLEEGGEVTFEDAKFMFVVCTAFINYLKTLNS